MATGRHRFEFLDGLRGLAAVSVMWGHITTLWPAAPWPAAFETAVDFFFMLSGFVVAHAYGERLQSGAMSFGRFVRLRIVRLYPMLVAGSLIGAAVVIWHVSTFEDVEWWRVWAAIGLNTAGLPSFPFPDPQHYPFPLNLPAWSLFWELAINVLYAASARFLGWRTLVGVLVVSAVAFGLCGIAYQNNGMGGAPHDFMGGLPRVTFGFTAGILIQRFPLQRRLGPLAGLAIIAALLVLLFAPIAIPRSIRLGLVMFAMPALMMAAAAVRWPAMDGISDALGRLSYPLYIIHYPIARFLHEGVFAPLDPDGRWMWSERIIISAACCGCAWALVRFYDEPVRRWLSSTNRSRQTMQRGHSST